MLDKVLGSSAKYHYGLHEAVKTHSSESGTSTTRGYGIAVKVSDGEFISLEEDEEMMHMDAYKSFFAAKLITYL